MGLPEKLYYSVSEIADRWKTSGEKLFHYFEMEILHPAIKFKSMLCELWEGTPNDTSNSKLIAEIFTTSKLLYPWNYNDLQRLYIDYQSEIHLNGKIFVFDYDNPKQWLKVHMLDVPTYVIGNDDFLITKSERDRFEIEHKINISSSLDLPTNEYVESVRIEELSSLSGKSKFDLTKLIRFCEELNSSWAVGNYFAVAMLLRSILDHIPPIFNCNNFSEVCNNYKGSKSFKESANNLDKSLRKISDGHLHNHISKKEVLPTKTQVNFSHTLDLLLAEIIKVISLS